MDGFGPPSATVADTARVRSDGPSGPRAGFWQRVGAAILDDVIVGVPFVVLTAALGVAGFWLGLAVGVAYYTALEGTPSGQTVGKRAVGIRVVSFETGGPIGYGRALLRTLGKWLSAIVFGLGYLWMLWDRERQCWHDKFAVDVVVPVSAYPVSER